MISHLLVLLVSSLHCFSGAQIVVNKSNGQDDLKCLIQDHPCKSLDFVSKQLGGMCSGLTILIEDPQLPVNSVITFENCTSLKISGKVDSSTILLCSNNVSCGGLKFRNVTNLHLLNMEMRSCGRQVSYIPFHSKAALHIHQSSNVTLTNMTFYNSSYTALVLSET